MSSELKVFGIGLNKTGTTTLGQCGRILGFRCLGCDKELLKQVVRDRDLVQLQDRVRQFGWFEDWPWPLVYKELDHLFPESKFILTVRQSEDVWLDSLKRHSMRTHPVNHCRKLAYGFDYPHGYERQHVEFYRQHNKSVRDYFKGRENDFLEICWENGDGFEKICHFLGCDIPDTPVPHANRGVDNTVPLKRYMVNQAHRLSQQYLLKWFFNFQ